MTRPITLWAVALAIVCATASQAPIEANDPFTLHCTKIRLHPG